MMQEDLDIEKLMTEHDGDHACVAYVSGNPVVVWYVAPHRGEPCLVYRLAARVHEHERPVTVMDIRYACCGGPATESHLDGCMYAPRKPERFPGGKFNG